ncbi:hypothetical protein BGX34_010224 [Mortierella sp. NVP85]|nr:hypothetical protein BGX34_010224 [Mortierella sp. NVP85]
MIAPCFMLLTYEDGSLVAVFGGFVNRSSTSDHSVYFLDTKTWIWTVSTSNSVRGRSYSACAFSGNQFIVWGGFYQNPTSTPNNLPSVEESTLVYSLDAQNWVSTFTPRDTAYGAGGNSGPNTGEQDGATGGNLSDPKGKSVGLILAIAAAGAILALVITGGAIMVIRKRNRRRRSNSTSTRHTSSQNGVAPMSSVGTFSTKGSSSNIWDQKLPSSLEAGLAANAGVNIALSSGKGGLAMTEDIAPVSGYNTWEHRGPISNHRENKVGMTTTTMTNPIIGVTQTTIVTTPKNGSKAGKMSNYTTNHRVPEQDHGQPSFSRSLTASTDNQPKDSWSESHQNQAYQSRTEHPISIEREYR